LTDPLDDESLGSIPGTAQRVPASPQAQVASGSDGFGEFKQGGAGGGEGEGGAGVGADAEQDAEEAARKAAEEEDEVFHADYGVVMTWRLLEGGSIIQITTLLLILFSLNGTRR
jgi:hypothetical protein